MNSHCISDATSGVTQSLRTITEWLADAGHDCQILTTARFESRATFTIEDHLRQLGVVPPQRPESVFHGRPGLDPKGHRSRSSLKAGLGERFVDAMSSLLVH